jgi:hypothetical protein
MGEIGERLDFGGADTPCRTQLAWVSVTAAGCTVWTVGGFHSQRTRSRLSVLILPCSPL